MVTLSSIDRTGQGLVHPPINVQKIDSRARIPEKFEETSIGLDVFAFLLTEAGKPTSRALHLKNVTEIPTRIRVAPPPGYFIQICSRLSLARKSIFVANAPGVLHPEFDEELTILLFNGSYETQYISHEHRIAQLIIQPIITSVVRELPTPQHQEDVCSGPREGHC